MLVAILTVLSLQVQSPDTAGAYRDQGTRELVRLARVRREAEDRSVRGYRTLAKEHLSVGLRALGRDRVLYRRETAARVDWRRDGPVRVDILGAREATPTGKVEVPDGLATSSPDYVFEPGARELLIGIDDAGWTRHPLASGSEGDYRFRSGDTVGIRLGDGTEVRVIELRVIPRRRNPRLVDGSLWLDARTYAVTRALYRPATAWEAGFSVVRKDSSVAVNVERRGRRRGVLPAVLPRARAEARLFAVEYGLHRQQWWMPRLVAVEGVAEVGSFTVPFKLERSYADYDLDVVAMGGPAPVDSAVAKCAEGSQQCRCSGGKCRRFEVRLPADTAGLVASAQLPPSIFADGEGTFTEGEADRLIEELQRMVPVPVTLGMPTLRWQVGPGVSRFNRVEGLAPGARVTAEFGGLAADAGVHVGTADWQPSLELGVTRMTHGAEHRLAGYRRLAAVDPATRALGLGNSASTLLWGRDYGEYFRAAGVELTGTPSRTERRWYDWRVFAEHQTDAPAEADWSVRHLLDGGYDFRPNIHAERADQVGAGVALRASRGLDPRGLRWNAGAQLEASTGTFDFARPSLAVGAGVPLPAGLAGALELAAGSAFGAVPAQSLWYLGGPATLRGYAGNTARGNAFWRGRAEVARAAPAARVALFSDVGWAGKRGDLLGENPLWSAGVGASFLDGLVRLDLARALVSPTGWRVDFYLGGVL